MIANAQQHYCKANAIGMFANGFEMDGLESDQQLIQDLCTWSRLAPSVVAKRADLAATTVLRAFRGTATTRISQPTLEKLKRAFPEFPGWRGELPDQVGMLGPRADPNERLDELVYVREVDISYAMGAGTNIEDYPETGLVPFNLGFLRLLTSTPTEHLFIAKGIGDSMEPTVLRSDVLMFDTQQTDGRGADSIWAHTYAGDGFVKRLRRVQGKAGPEFLILSDNQLVPPQPAAIEDVHIIGKLVWIGRRT